MSSEERRPGKDEYYMNLAIAVRKRANCMGRKVGAVLVKGDRVIATGYNGTPSDLPNCDEGGCIRCAKHRAEGVGYDVCICVHAEANLLMTAARHGISVEGSTVYSTLQPCFACGKEMLQAHITRVVYAEPWMLSEKYDDLKPDYERIMARLQAEKLLVPTEPSRETLPVAVPTNGVKN